MLAMWEFEVLSERPDLYTDMAGAQLDLASLSDQARDDLAELIKYYNEKPPYPQFKTFWHAFDSPISVHLDGRSATAKTLFAVGRDLEKRLGIAQGRVKPE